MVLIMESLRDYCLKVKWNLPMVNLFSTDIRVLGPDEGKIMGSTDGETIGTILGNTTNIWQT